LSSGIYALTKADELRDARELAEKASLAKTEFLAVMSHEVRTPLTAISGHLDLCLSTSLTRQQREHLSRARVSSRALLEVVDDILDFSKIEAQRLELESVRFEIEELLDQVAGTHALDAAKKGLELVIDADPELPRSLVGDPLRLSQVLSNLLGNAIKFSTKGEVVLRIVAEPPANGSGLVLNFSVRDAGIGMTAPELERVFRPFTQADSSTTRRYGGTGLGLSICKRLVAMMGGELLVESAPDRGSLFHFAARFDAPVSRAEPSLIGVGVRLLIVEDSAAQTQALCRLLQSHGFEAVVARDGKTALGGVRDAVAEGRPFGVALIDQTLPDLDGLTLIERLSNDAGPSLPCVLISTANSDLWLGANFARHGAAAVISKPFQATSLLRAIARARKLKQSSWPPSFRSPLNPTRLRGRKILVVQDDPVARELAREILEMSGAEVEVTSNGIEAVERTRHKDFDAILMDLHLPELDGCDATRSIRREARNGSTPVLGITASGSAADRELCLAAGMESCVTTPIEPAEFLTALESAMAARPRTQPSPAESPPRELASSASVLMRAVRMPIDTQQALSRLDGDLETYRRLLQRFLSSHSQAPEELKRAIGESDLETAIRLVHTMSSAAANVGATHLHRLSQTLETAARRDFGFDRQAVTEFEQAHSATLAAITATLEATAPQRFNSTTASSAELGSLIGRLHRLLVEHDTAAVEGVRRLTRALGDAAHGYEHLQRLATSIEAYNFEHARDELIALSRVLGLQSSDPSSTTESIPASEGRDA
jgi:CheY-like chemotaxis protein/HPt (histidine-containing phosphotransfer) domain-containing protein